MISIIIPAYNEEKRIGKTLENYGRFFDELKNEKKVDSEIIVVINNTMDKTEEIVKKYIKKYKIIKYLNFKLGGKGFAITEGFKEALKGKAEYIGFVDADMATLPQEYYRLYNHIGNYDGIIASRWMKGSKIKVKQTILRRILSRGFNFIVNSLFLFNYKDTQCGAKIFKRVVIEEIISEINLTEWAFDIDLLYKIKRKKFKINEIETEWNDKIDTKINIIKTPFKMFSGVLRLRLIYSPFNFIVKAYDRLPGIIKFHHRI